MKGFDTDRLEANGFDANGFDAIEVYTKYI